MAWNLGLLGAAAGGGNPYFFGYFQNGDPREIASLDSAGNFYLGGRTSTNWQWFKIQNGGQLALQKSFGGGSDDALGSITFDSSDNIYLTGYTNSAGAGSADGGMAKLDSSGATIWQRTVGGSSTDYLINAATTSGGDTYAAGYTLSAGAGDKDIFIVKRNSSGVLQWQKAYGFSNEDASEDGELVALDSSGNIWVGGTTNLGEVCGALIKLDSSGTRLTDRVISTGLTSVNMAIRGVAVDSNDNLIISGWHGTLGGFVSKLNSFGSTTWSRYIDTSGFDIVNTVALDSSDNIYCTGRFTSSPYIGIMKFDSSGTLQWQREIALSSSQGLGIAVDDAAGVVYITANKSNKYFVAALPTDGSLTGVYEIPGVLTNINYRASSYSVGALSLNNGGANYTETTTGFTDAAMSLSNSTTSITYDYQQI